MTPPHTTAVPEPRLSLRVAPELKARVGATVAELQQRGLRTTASELVAVLVEDGLRADLDALETRLRAWRAERAAGPAYAEGPSTPPPPPLQLPPSPRATINARRPPSRPARSARNGDAPEPRGAFRAER